jgi:hypothetical protein
MPCQVAFVTAFGAELLQRPAAPYGYDEHSHEKWPIEIDGLPFLIAW